MFETEATHHTLLAEANRLRIMDSNTVIGCDPAVCTLTFLRVLFAFDAAISPTVYHDFNLKTSPRSSQAEINRSCSP
jgi:hypothetical protein